MDSEGLRINLVEAQVSLGGLKSEHRRLASEMIQAAEAGDAQEFVRLSMEEWTLPGRLADQSSEASRGRVEYARARLADAQRRIAEATDASWSAMEGVRGAWDERRIERGRERRETSQWELERLQEEREQAAKDVAMGEAVLRMVQERIGWLDELSSGGRPPYDPADFAMWYQLQRDPTDTDQWRKTEWWSAVEEARNDAAFGRYYRG